MICPYYESVNLLLNEDVQVPSVGIEKQRIMMVLEDANSPITRKYHEKLYKSVVGKGHVDFGSIPKSAGNIQNYEGYTNMVETLKAIKGLTQEMKASTSKDYVQIIEKAIENIKGLSPVYTKGFSTKCEYVMLEYNSYVFTCVEATSALLYEYIEFIKRPDTGVLSIELKNTKQRANLFFIEQLQKFNKVNDTMGTDYRKMLEMMMTKGKDNFIGIDTATVIGVAAVSAVALSIVPVTRAVIYQIYKVRGNVAKDLEAQAKFLEMNKACVEANEAFTEDKRVKIIKKQEKLRQELLKLSDFLKVKAGKSVQEAKRDISNDNKMLSIDNLRSEVDDSPLELM